MKDQDSGAWARCRKTDDGGYKVTDDTVWHDILKEVDADVVEMLKKEDADTLTFIEFSNVSIPADTLALTSYKVAAQKNQIPGCEGDNCNLWQK